MRNDSKESGAEKRAAAFTRALRRVDISPEVLLAKLLRSKEAAEMLGKTEGALRVMLHRKEIPAVRNGRSVRYRLLDLIVWIEEHTSSTLS